MSRSKATGPQRLLDVGCGERPHPDADQLVDIRDLDGVDQAPAHDLPYTADSFDVIHSRAVLEHIKPDKLPAVFREFARVLRPGGTLEFRVPHAATTGAHDAPSHRSTWTIETPRLVAGDDPEFPDAFDVDDVAVVAQWPNKVHQKRRLQYRGARLVDELAAFPFVTARVEAKLRRVVS